MTNHINLLKEKVAKMIYRLKKDINLTFEVLCVSFAYPKIPEIPALRLH